MEDEKVIDITKQIKKAQRKEKWKRRWNAANRGYSGRDEGFEVRKMRVATAALFSFFY